jgi:glycosyltransferase involved in cell wall biosynthesis
VAGNAARYFQGADGFDQTLSALLDASATLSTLRAASRARFDSEFTWEQILGRYEALLMSMRPQAHTALISAAKSS